MLVVSFHLVGLAAMLIGIDVLVIRIELDSLNDPIPPANPGGWSEMVTCNPRCKGRLASRTCLPRLQDMTLF